MLRTGINHFEGITFQLVWFAINFEYTNFGTFSWVTLISGWVYNETCATLTFRQWSA